MTLNFLSPSCTLPPQYPPGYASGYCSNPPSGFDSLPQSSTWVRTPAEGRTWGPHGRSLGGSSLERLFDARGVGIGGRKAEQTFRFLLPCFGRNL
ncbi:hypothetical protein BDW67DRAFT_156047 [Aspergillus spinulosporus]